MLYRFFYNSKNNFTISIFISVFFSACRFTNKQFTGFLDFIPLILKTKID